jgi:hypothetical protein
MLKKVFLMFLVFTVNPLFSVDFNFTAKVNEYRNERGLTSLFIEENLNRTAEKYAQVLIEEGKISHIDKSGRRVLQRYYDEGGTAVMAGEILGTAKNLNEIFTAWKNSETHNRLLLDPKWNRIGFSFLEKNGVYVGVMLFSTSLIDGYTIIAAEDLIHVQITSIDRDRNLHFPKEYSKISTYTYEMILKHDELPLLLPVSYDFEGTKKISDFLYIPDLLLNETH